MKNIYFISDAHLGSLAIEHQRTNERRLVNFLEAIRHKAEAIFLMGDMFDFWFEYKDVVPKGYTRFLGKLSELTDDGVEIHFFTGNHDQWCGDYLSKECGVTIHREPYTCELCGKLFFMAHGHGLSRRIDNWKTRFLFSFFESKLMLRLAKMIHPGFFIPFGRNWAKHSRLKRKDGKECPYLGSDKEPLVLFAKQYLQSHSSINYFIFGHRHIQLDEKIAPECRAIILGEWITLFTYAVFDGEHLFVDNFIEGETEL